ncbi:hypothetical protein B4O97_02920 [Marispirochaeta aestuarii]|uniref:Sialidase domain-containing protein n=2 Tax=Marispirochaeta aestuarii TaxID=1963862 RepID=A0A1Y1S2E8_9SPIO|nr:hypothetical protein B4O97_02920 [Marispirochaeta aestuarii]
MLSIFYILEIKQDRKMKIISSHKIPTPCTSNHASNLLELEDGNLLCTWFGGSMEGSSDVSIYLSRFDSSSETWSPAEKMSDDPTRSEQNPVIFTSPGKELWLLYTAQLKTDQGTAIVRRRRSRDGGKTWEGIEDLFTGEGTFIRQTPVVNSRGYILVPIWHSNIKNAFGDDTSLVMVSRDGGSSWETIEVPESNGCVHMNILSNCRAAFYRSRRSDRIYRSVSDDDGLSWSKPEATELPNNNASIQARLLSDDRILIIYNENSARGRKSESSIPPWIQDKEDFLRQCRITEKSAVWGVPRNPLVISSSDDLGLNWKKELVVESDPNLRSEHDHKGSFIGDYSYPSVIQGRDGRIHISYSYLRDYIQHRILSL